MKIITYNVDRGRNSSVPTAIAKMISDFQPDYICLQEYRYSAELEEMCRQQQYDTVNFVYHRKKSTTTNLLIIYKSDRHIESAWHSKIRDYILMGFESKGLQAVLFNVADTKELIINIHLPIWHFNRRKVKHAINFIAETLGSVNDTNVVVCGDFNIISRNSAKFLINEMRGIGLQPISPLGATLNPNNVNEKLFKLDLHVDWVFSNIANFKDSQILSEVYSSDHFPILAEI